MNSHPRPPSSTGDGPASGEKGGGRFRILQLQATDPGNFPMTWTLNTGPAGMYLDPNTSTLLWTPTADEVGYQPVTGKGKVTLYLSH